MSIRNKIDSNETGLAFAEEVLGTPGVLPVTPDWFPLEPNEYDDFGGELTLIARRPINSSRQRKKGSITDLEATGGFNQDFTQENSQRLLQGFMYASLRNKTNDAITSVTATGFVVPDETLFKVGQIVRSTGCAVLANNSARIVTSIDAGSSEVRTAGLSVEAVTPAGAKLTVVGQVAVAGVLSVDVTGNFAKLKSTTLDFTTLGLIPGEFIYIGGDTAGTSFTNAANNGFKRIRSITATEITIDKSTLPMVNEVGGVLTVHLYFGRVLKNELGNLIVRRSYQLERQLGAPDSALPNQVQSEYLVGAFGNEMVMNIEQADKINVDYSFVALDNEQRTATQGIKAGTRNSIVEADAYNTSTDFSSLRLSIYDGTNEAPSPLFAHLLDMSVTINNNVSVNKAVGILGGFDVTLGIFEVMAEMTAYFSTIEAVQAVRLNRDVTMHAAIAKDNAGFVMDIPLAALGDARLEVKIDEPITLPIKMDAATAVKINPETDYTMLWVFFDYLPTIASA
jgi:hypothetical protein